jgi:hypothetical protein
LKNEGVEEELKLCGGDIFDTTVTILIILNQKDIYIEYQVRGY